MSKPAPWTTLRESISARKVSVHQLWLTWIRLQPSHVPVDTQRQAVPRAVGKNKTEESLGYRHWNWHMGPVRLHGTTPPYAQLIYPRDFADYFPQTDIIG